MYLPQYYETELNSKFWGKGYTDWVAVKQATPLFKGHKQPKSPLNNFYYDLSQESSIRWQAELAKKYSVSGFGIYHYWFNSKEQALTRPAEIILNHKDIDINYFFAWDNKSWKRTWSNVEGNDWAPKEDINMAHNGPKVLMKYELGNENDWEKHFNYLLPYFLDNRYVRHDGKPIFIIYNYKPELLKMFTFWDAIAMSNGLKGIEYIVVDTLRNNAPANIPRFRYEPSYSAWGGQHWLSRVRYKVHERKDDDLLINDYERTWKRIIRSAQKCNKADRYYGGFVRFDDSPRRGYKGRIFVGENPQIFEKYLKELVYICKQQNKEYIFLTAWNEWGEGAYLEPDEETGYQYLAAYKRAIESQ